MSEVTIDGIFATELPADFNGCGPANVASDLWFLKSLALDVQCGCTHHEKLHNSHFSQYLA